MIIVDNSNIIISLIIDKTNMHVRITQVSQLQWGYLNQVNIMLELEPCMLLLKLLTIFTCKLAET